MEYEEKLQEIFDETRILRRPVSGIVSDYHELSYLLIGPAPETGTARITGRIKVSPRLIVTPRQLLEKFGELFDDGELMDTRLQMRSFQFTAARSPSRQVRSEDFRIEYLEGEPQRLLDDSADELARAEDVRTGLVFCPDTHFYPVSIDRFIRSMLDREFRG